MGPNISTHLEPMYPFLRLCSELQDARISRLDGPIPVSKTYTDFSTALSSSGDPHGTIFRNKMFVKDVNVSWM